MINAKEEFLDAVTDHEVIAAIVKYNGKTFLLRENHTNEQRNRFLDNLDFEYDDGFGSQELYGTVWLENGKWLDRGQYDGSQWWELRQRPFIPLELR